MISTKRTERARFNADEVLKFWAEGLTSGAIQMRTGIPRTSVCVIVQRARANGDPRAHSRKRGGKFPFAMSQIAHKALVAEADRREISTLQLASQILDAVCTHNLFGAVFDD